ncbi:hypothetical protein Ciccas_014541, partial [Cichlidogyrus casuarinus]
DAIDNQVEWKTCLEPPTLLWIYCIGPEQQWLKVNIRVKGFTYELRAVTNHASDRSHYVAQRLHEGAWYLFDDLSQNSNTLIAEPKLCSFGENTLLYQQIV